MTRIIRSARDLAPQKFDQIDLTNLDSFVDDDRWVAEQKLDGARCMVRLDAHGGAPVYLTHGGKLLTHAASKMHFGALDATFRASGLQGRGEFVFDGELIHETGTLWLFDLPWSSVGPVVPGDTLATRRAALEALAPLFDAVGGDRVRIAPQARTAAEKRRLADTVLAQGGEGLMLKRVDSPYEPLARVKHSLKAKFVKTADFVVIARDVGGKNAHLAVHDHNGSLIKVGACSMIGKPDAQEGDVVEVRYLYWTGESIYQPTLLRIRTDKPAGACDLGQFQTVSREVVAL